MTPDYDVRNRSIDEQLADCQAENARLQSAIDMLRANVETNAGSRPDVFAYVWMNVWDEFERQVDAKPTTAKGDDDDA